MQSVLTDMQVMQRDAKTKIHGWKAGWRMFQYVDPAEEVAFVTNEFMQSRNLVVFVSATGLIGAPCFLPILRHESAAAGRGICA